MSRCFPFPPPGYETKHIPEDLEVLKEVKHKEKKEKKDKERRKDREKKEKDGKGEKHRDKKDRKEKHKDKKEKHRDKKKDKEDRGKDKEKSSISEESTVAGKIEEQSGEKLHSKGHSNRSSVEDEGKSSTLFQGQNGGKPFQSLWPSQATNEAKFVQELDRRIRDDERGRWSQFPERVASVDKMDQESAASTATRNPPGELSEEKGNNGNKRIDIRKMDTREQGHEFTGKAMVQNLSRVAKSKVEGVSRSMEEQNHWRLEDKEKYKETDHEKRRDKDKVRDKKMHGKDKDKEKEKKKEEKGKVNIENKKSEPEKSKSVARNDLVGATSHKSTNLLKDVDNNALNDGNIRKRKDMDTNGFLHESEIRPYKIERPAPHLSTENGRKLEASRVSCKPSFDKHAVLNNVGLHHKDRLINGIVEAQKPSPSKPSPPGTMVSDQIIVAPKVPHNDFNEANVEDHIAEASRRPPHPDLKYLSQVLTVPKVGDGSENDDQEWLFNEKGPSNKPKLELAGFKEGEEPRVWSEAVHIESADVFALPYVIPY